MIHAIAIDDEPLPLEILQEYCRRIGFISLKQVFTKVTEAERYLGQNQVDLLFLDIQMPKVSGIDFYRSLQSNVMVIFTTAYSQYAIDGFNLSAVDYLLKPFSYKRFEEAAKKAQNQYALNRMPELQEQFLTVRVDYSLVQVALQDIVFIESFSDYIDIHLQNDKKVTVRMTMKGILEKLPARDFTRVHRSFIIALKKIEKVRRKVIFIEGRQIPLSGSYESDFMKRFDI